jgi:hypothetical protein
MRLEQIGQVTLGNLGIRSEQLEFAGVFQSPKDTQRVRNYFGYVLSVFAETSSVTAADEITQAAEALDGLEKLDTSYFDGWAN